MKKSLRSRLCLAFSGLMLATALSGCSSSSADITIRVYNCEDYIGEDEFDYEDSNGESYTFSDVLSGFEELESKKLGKSVQVIYDTYDTNETMLSSLKTGKTSYDLIVASDYTVQRMMSLNMLQPIDLDRVPNYADYASPYLISCLEGLDANIDGVSEKVSDYALGYMWGTLGILYNPAKVASDKDLSEDEVKLAMNSWDSLWDSRFKNEMSVKDSMRDTYSVGIMELFKDEIAADLTSSGCFDEDFNLLESSEGGVDYWQKAVDEYSPKLAEIFNRCDEETVEKVKDVLLRLKENIFGFEVDSGKEDMVKGLVGMNLAWSGDAVFSMDTAEEADRYLYYSVPKTGGNIWFDGWMMSKTCSGQQQDVAYDFLDFVSDPQVATANMNTIGYTSFIAGDTVHDLILDWYDPRYTGDWEDGDEEGATYEGERHTWQEIAEAEEWDTVNLTYMFEDTLSDEIENLGEDPVTNPYLFYTDEFETIEVGEDSCVVGRQFYAQYPPEELIPKLAIMKDYGDNNKYVLAMWQDVKSNNLPLAAVIVFAVILGAALVLIVASVIGKHRYHKLRVARRKANVRKEK